MTPVRGRRLGRRVLTAVGMFPELHDQDTIACGTAACLHGWTLAIAVGYRPGDFLDEGVMRAGQDLDANRFKSESSARLLFGDAADAHLLATYSRRVYCEADPVMAVAAYRELVEAHGTR